MARIALIDDDATEALILEGMLEFAEGDHTLIHISSVAAFASHAGEVDVVLLDRRLPPFESFSQGLAALAETGWRGPVVLITAHSDEAAPAPPQGMRLIGPVEKSALLTPEAVARVIDEALASGARPAGA